MFTRIYDLTSTWSVAVTHRSQTPTEWWLISHRLIGHFQIFHLYLKMQFIFNNVLFTFDKCPLIFNNTHYWTCRFLVRCVSYLDSIIYNLHLVIFYLYSTITHVLNNYTFIINIFSFMFDTFFLFRTRLLSEMIFVAGLDWE